MKYPAARLVGFLAISLLAACAPHVGMGDVPGPGDASTALGPTLDGGAGDAATANDGGTCATHVTCASAGANCGPISDGCGGILQCGTCTGNDTCGGGGTASVCGNSCVPKTCADLGYNCGPAGDGCGGSLNCGTCTNGDTCGGGGSPSVCGSMSVCVPKTCADLGYNCGPAGDGCGGSLDCGTCSSGQSCGGGGVPSVCGAPPCTPKTCAGVGPATCGPIGDGCGGIIQCGNCTEPDTCGGQTPSQCGIPASCTNLCTQQVGCSNPAVTTTVTGVVYAPNGTDPLPNVLVYVPNGTVKPFAAGVACEPCSAGVSGSPLVSTTTDVNGAFTLSNMPVGANIPLVIQTGRWRRQVTIPSVASCTNTALAASLTRLPKNKSEGDIPKMAFVTGAVDSLECVMRKIGVDDAEFTKSSGSGRINLFVGDTYVDQPGYGYSGGANAGSNTPWEYQLTGSSTALANYDMVFFPCGGYEYDRPSSELTNLVNYADAGGRVFATHFSYEWLAYDSFDVTADWAIDEYSAPPDQTGYIDTGFPKGATLAQWLYNIGASTTLGQIAINTLRKDATAVVSPAQEWMHIANGTPMHYTFNTPLGASAANQCGRVLFDDFHVENNADAWNTTFPAECTSGTMTAQEKLLEFMIFDLGSCVTPDVPPPCQPTTCAAQGIGCGPAGDGCGGSLDCGTCSGGQTCGGGGVPSQCGSPSCTPKTCQSQGIQCGPAGDGCGGSLSCGSCPQGQTCGGGGTPGVCGAGSCTPTTCAAQGIECGPAGDGCGGSLDCGTCSGGQTCGGGGTAGMCGSLCIPKTCVELGYNCGPAGDGCGGQLNCGTCTAPLTCGGGGSPNVCGDQTIQ